MNVYCYPVSRNSTYLPLLFTGIEDRYRRIYREDGSLDDAADELARGRGLLVHIHWEEFVLRECETAAQADLAVDEFLQQLRRIRALGGAIVWTVHNEVPHLIAFRDQFLALRREVARHACVVLVHNEASIERLAAQVEVDRKRIVVLPHPSYLDRFEDETTLRAGLGANYERRIQGFGWIRLQKGFGEMIGMLPAPFLAARAAHIRISGEGVEAPAVRAQHADRIDVQWDLRHVPDADVPDLLRSAACVVLPYQRVLTTGVASLAMSVGALLVAVDVPQLREAVSSESRRFLYPPGDGRALREIVDAVLSLSSDERRAVIAANLEVARSLHPATVSQRLAAIYDGVIRAVFKERSRARL